MSDKWGIYLEKLIVFGDSKESAIINFNRGLNVISGDSNTGKSYIFKCIDYLFGASKKPKEISHANGYSNAAIQFKTTDKVFTLLRDIKNENAKALLYECTFEEIAKHSPKELKPKHSETDDSISSFFLKQCGFEAARVKVNKQDKTNNLTFRILSNLFLVDEISIIEEKSPILNQSSTDNTKQQSAFKFMISGRDDSHLQEIEVKKIRESKRKAKIELFEQLIQNLQDSIDKDKASLGKENLDWDSMIEEITSSLKGLDRTIATLVQERNEKLEMLTTSKSRRNVVEELLNRFALLERSYQNDLERLDFMSEGDYYFKQLEAVICPVCGTHLSDHKSLTECTDNLDETILRDIESACKRESEKISAHLVDLQTTVATLKQEQLTLNSIIENEEIALESLSSEIDKKLVPIYRKYKARYKEVSEKQRLSARIANNQEKLTDYVESKIDLEKLKLEGDPKSSEVIYQGRALKDFCGKIKSILEDWRFKPINSVNFDTAIAIADLVIDGEPRASFGKGFRGITHASFAIGLMRFCIEQHLPHTRLVILDSPIVTLDDRRGGNHTSDDVTPNSMKDAFFEDIFKADKKSQIIILENDMPPDKIRKEINFIEFSGDPTKGRAGFFPSQPD